MKILILTRESKTSDDIYAIQPNNLYWYARDLMWMLMENHEVDITIFKPDAIAFCDYDLVISYFYPHILKAEHINAPRYGCINSHIAYLPFNRGANPNVHSILDPSTIAGVTIHKIDEGIDTGNILAQKVVDVSPIDTGKSLYHKLERSAYDLWIEYWPILESLLESTGELPPGMVQNKHVASYHRSNELNMIDDLESRFGYDTAHQFIDTLRARTFAPYKGAYIRDTNGRKVYVRIELEYEDEDTKS